jgi:hypothetical protein
MNEYIIRKTIWGVHFEKKIYIFIVSSDIYINDGMFAGSKQQYNAADTD